MNDILSIKDITKNYYTKEGVIKALDKISFDIKQGEIISLVGPSGCGKSTLLSILSNLDKDYSGNILSKDNLKVAYMFQSNALFPWLTIYDNATLGLKITNNMTKDNLEYVDYLFNLYNLNEFKNSYPRSLSGGMMQRVG